MIPHMIDSFPFRRRGTADRDGCGHPRKGRVVAAAPGRGAERAPQPNCALQVTSSTPEPVLERFVSTTVPSTEIEQAILLFASNATAARMNPAVCPFPTVTCCVFVGASATEPCCDEPTWSPIVLVYVTLALPEPVTV